MGSLHFDAKAGIVYVLRRVISRDNKALKGLSEVNVPKGGPAFGASSEDKAAD